MSSDELDFGTDIAVEAGVLEACEHHIDYFKTTGKDTQAAYRLANARFHSAPPNGWSRRQMTDAIQNAINHHYYPGGACPRCEQIRERDERGS